MFSLFWYLLLSFYLCFCFLYGFRIRSRFIFLLLSSACKVFSPLSAFCWPPSLREGMRQQIRAILFFFGMRLLLLPLLSVEACLALESQHLLFFILVVFLQAGDSTTAYLQPWTTVQNCSWCCGLL